jgi:DNA mismatch repair protein MutH
MEREQALTLLSALVGKDLRSLADLHAVTVWKQIGALRTINKGWAGHVVERFLGLPLNSSRAPNFGSWELKVVPLQLLSNGLPWPKETMAITMLDPVEVVSRDFENSHLFLKLRKIVVLSRIFESRAENRSIVHAVRPFDLIDRDIYERVKADYELIRRTIKEAGFDGLTGRLGELVQPRTKGPGHGSTSRAFYARKHFLTKILGLT